jgi:hypothetical protein
MTTVEPTVSNPFALLMEPEAIFAAMASSERLARLKSRICRPLDKPPVAHADVDDTAKSDESIDGTAPREESDDS